MGSRKKVTLEDVDAAIVTIQTLTYKNQKYAGELVAVQTIDGAEKQFICSFDLTLQLDISRHFRLSVNPKANPYPTGKDSGIKIDGSIKKVAPIPAF